MEDSFAKELYSESLQLTNAELGSRPIADGLHSLVLDCNEGEVQGDGGSLWDGSDEEFDGEPDLDRGGKGDMTSFTLSDIGMV